MLLLQPWDHSFLFSTVLQETVFHVYVAYMDLVRQRGSLLLWFLLCWLLVEFDVFMILILNMVLLWGQLVIR